MSIIHLQRIENALNKLFAGKIDMSDASNRQQDEQRTILLSRALAAYPIGLLTDIDADDAASTVTDGFDDNGIDAIYFDQSRGVLYVAQSKWISDGNGSIAQRDCRTFLSGFRDLVSLRLDRFNDRVRAREAELRAALYDSNVTFVLILAHTGDQKESVHVRREADSLLEEMNTPEEVVSVEFFNQSRLYSAVSGHVQRHSICLEVLMHDWGYVEEPYLAYYGQVDAASIARWWQQHGRSLFARNIRNFKGSTDVNASIHRTLVGAPQHFLYFNNGVTILCSSVHKMPIGGSTRNTGLFDCQGINVVNGAQTIGIIGTTFSLEGDIPEDARVFVRLVSLEKCPQGFDKELTRATNTQNRIEHRDFASLDPNQQRLASEMLLDGLYYSYKSGDQESKGDDGCTLADATVALACASDDVALAVQTKREIGRLWQDIENQPYTTLFNEATDAKEMWRAVQIMRAVDASLQRLSRSSHPRAGMVAVHGNRFILHHVFQDPAILCFRDPAKELEGILAEVDRAADAAFTALAMYLEDRCPNAYLASFFKNLQRCRAAGDALVSQLRSRENRHGRRSEQEGQLPLFEANREATDPS